MGFVQIALRGAQFLLVLITTALIGNVIHEAFAGNSSSINFAIFVCVLSWVVVLFGLAASFVASLAIPIALMVADGIAVACTFIAGTVLAAKLGVHSCGNDGYTHGNPLTNGSTNPTKRCHELQASTAFFWFLFALFAASLAMDFIERGGSTTMRRGGIRKGPSMSQV